MPYLPNKPCAYRGCPALVPSTERYCPEHKHLNQQRLDRDRGTSSERGYDSHWRKVRQMQLAAYPLCHDCETQGAITAAREVHHIKALSDGGTNDFNNLMSLCSECHKKRTVKENGALR